MAVHAVHTYFCNAMGKYFLATRGVVTFDSKEPPTQPPQNVYLSSPTQPQRHHHLFALNSLTPL